MQIDGRCHCGHVTYQADIDPQRVSICHCRLALKGNGDLFARWTTS